MAALEILYEDNHCLAINKPAGRVTTHYQGGEETLDREIKFYLKQKYSKPGKVFLGVVHRLDRPVSGVLLFARTSKAAARLSDQFRQGSIEKVYWAVVEGTPPHLAGSLADWLRKDDQRGRVDIVTADTPDAKQALLHYQRKCTRGGLSLVEVRPQTGRTHQLRVQLSHHGHPIYGDAKYGSIHTFGNSIALHARTLVFLHPTKNVPIEITAEVPQPWRGRFAYLLAGKGDGLA
ncbi:MAG: RluA family pseudouridine synthase [Gemmataceae bacterium]